MSLSASLRYRFPSPLLLLHHCWNQRFSYILSGLLLLQRSPVIRHLFELPRQLAPRFADILRVAAPVTVGAGATHSVTGATGVVPVHPSANPAQARVGEPFAWVFRTTGEKAKSYSFAGLPPGIVDSGLVQNAVSSIGGSPTQPGEFDVRIIGWEKTGQRGRKTPVYTLTLNITGGQPPTISEHPAGGTFNEGAPAVLSVTAGGPGLSYQWKKNGQPLAGTAFQDAVLQIGALTPEDAGLYTVEISNGNGVLTSDGAQIVVRPAGSYLHWQALHGLSSPLGDPDGDGMPNLTEYAIGTDPKVALLGGVPTVRLERVAGVAQLVAEFPVDPRAIDSLVQIETSSDLQPSSWAVLGQGERGAMVVSEGGRLTVRFPADSAVRFLRLKVSLR